MSRVIVLALFLVSAASRSAGGIIETQQSPPTATVSEYSLRRLAIEAPMPEYPAASIASKSSGVAVAELASDASGAVKTVDVLQAPDTHTARALEEALKRWTFRPLGVKGTEGGRGARSKLTFYFELTGGKGRVLNPDEMPGGESFKTKLQPRTGSSASPGGPPSAGPAVVTSHDTEPVKEITLAELQRLSGADRPTILDIGDRAAFKRGHRDGAVNIPVDELPVRARIEMRGSKFVVVDCTQEEQWRCKVAAHLLKEAGVSRFALLQRH